MSTITAQILIGQGHPNHGGIRPSHFVFLSENSRPALILVNDNIYQETAKKISSRVTWIPTVDNMLDDAILMVAVHVFKEPSILAYAKQVNIGITAERIELYSIDISIRQSFYEKCRELKNNAKLVFTILEGSTFLSQISNIESYQFDFEICKSICRREFSVWSNKLENSGSLM